MSRVTSCEIFLYRSGCAWRSQTRRIRVAPPLRKTAGTGGQCILQICQYCICAHARVDRTTFADMGTHCCAKPLPINAIRYSLHSPSRRHLTLNHHYKNNKLSLPLQPPSTPSPLPTTITTITTTLKHTGRVNGETARRVARLQLVPSLRAWRVSSSSNMGWDFAKTRWPWQR